MNKIITATLLTAAVAIPGVAASAALAAPTNRPGGAITTPESPTPANGGDQGWGNCGHNSSGGNPHTGDNGQGGGNGGDSKADCNPRPHGTSHLIDQQRRNTGGADGGRPARASSVLEP